MACESLKALRVVSQLLGSIFSPSITYPHVIFRVIRLSKSRKQSPTKIKLQEPSLSPSHPRPTPAPHPGAIGRFMLLGQSFSIDIYDIKTHIIGRCCLFGKLVIRSPKFPRVPKSGAGAAARVGMLRGGRFPYLKTEI